MPPWKLSGQRKNGGSNRSAVKKVLLRAENRLPRGGFFFSAAGQIMENIKTEPITYEVLPQRYRLCVLASGSLIIFTIPRFILIKVSCLHFGQNKGKFINSVSFRTLTRVLLLQIGHNIHDCFSTATPPFILTEYKIHTNVMRFSRKRIAQLSVSYSQLANQKLMCQYSSKNLPHHFLYVEPQI